MQDRPSKKGDYGHGYCKHGKKVGEGPREIA